MKGGMAYGGPLSASEISGIKDTSGVGLQLQVTNY
jgi:hypothetical protein